MLQVVENITIHLDDVRKKRAEKAKEKIKDMTEKEREMALSEIYGIKSIFDLTNIPENIKKKDTDDRFRTSLFDELSEYIQHGYAFMPYALYLACALKLEKIKPFSIDEHFNCFKIKDGEVIHVSAG